MFSPPHPILYSRSLSQEQTKTTHNNKISKPEIKKQKLPTKTKLKTNRQKTNNTHKKRPKQSKTKQKVHTDTIELFSVCLLFGMGASWKNGGG